MPHISARFQREWLDRELEGRVDGRAGRKPRRPPDFDGLRHLKTFAINFDWVDYRRRQAAIGMAAFDSCDPKGSAEKLPLLRVELGW